MFKERGFIIDSLIDYTTKSIINIFMFCIGMLIVAGTFPLITTTTIVLEKNTSQEFEIPNDFDLVIFEILDSESITFRFLPYDPFGIGWHNTKHERYSKVILNTTFTTSVVFITYLNQTGSITFNLRGIINTIP